MINILLTLTQLITELILSKGFFGHTLTEAVIIITCLYVLLKYGFKKAVIYSLMYLTIHEWEWILVYAIKGYPNAIGFVSFTAGGESFWVGLMFIFYALFIGYKWVDLRLVGETLLGMLPFYVLWFAIGLPVYDTYYGATIWVNNVAVNFISILSWIIMSAVFLYCLKRSEKRRGKK